jgi:general secretion pathway protein I
MKHPTHPAQPACKPLHTKGFTLIEVLVALSIVAVALMAGLKATGALSHNAERQTLAMLGQICADNELIRLRLLRQIPNIGSTQSPCLQAGLELQVELVVQPTPNPNFRRVDARVLHQGQGILQVSTIMGQG